MTEDDALSLAAHACRCGYGVHGFVGGHLAHIDQSSQRCWGDTPNAPIAEIRPCPKCNVVVPHDGPDPCLGLLPGVLFACCGHGIHFGAVILSDSSRHVADSLGPDVVRALVSDETKIMEVV